MIFAHDAGTGLMTLDKPDSIFVNAAAQTQVGSLVDLANCGARAFDIRPWLLEDGSLVTHHGGYLCEEKLEKELKNLIEWNAKHPQEVRSDVTLNCDAVTRPHTSDPVQPPKLPQPPPSSSPVCAHQVVPL